ncbi:TetR/AcrR family transcriptional regulator [Variovorax sp. PAMC26660]|uniref:TetR/AcrR family transcriptional regulator n=1 Tax=Variovorax sp. PAMC26660 TaxID=2762322 RepID=UPI00164E823E|nr:TetR/AcrR family transcriptional regulator [Variovorax sp. PAMC26660]QNK65294.1 TetR/AcrR family transcriptional regulator [Variovorax sp. PAMC26660]
MRYPPAETAEKHQKILDEASRLFKERGFDGVSVSEIMKATGLTHGPFYNHFASKEALMAECIDHASAAALAQIDSVAETPDGLLAYMRAYLSADHRDDRGQGCLMAAFAEQTGREQGLSASLTAHLKATIERFTKHFPWRTKKAARSDAILMLAAMLGGVVIARAVNDKALSDEVLEEVRTGLERLASKSATGA